MSNIEKLQAISYHLAAAQGLAADLEVVNSDGEEVGSEIYDAIAELHNFTSDLEFDLTEED